MNDFTQMKALLRGKSGKQLIAVSVAVFLLIAVMVLYSVMTLCGSIRLKQMDECLGEIPKIVDSRMTELNMRNLVYEEDRQVRAALGEECSELPTVEVLDDWSVILDRMLAEGDAVAFAKTGDDLDVYPPDGFTPEQLAKLKEELPAVFQRAERSRVVKLLGKRYLATLQHYPKAETDILLTVPLIHVVRNGIFISIAILAIISLGMILFQLYAFRRLSQKRAESGTDAFSRGQVYRETWPGMLVMLVVTALFSAMLLLLESRSNASLTATARRVSVQHEIDWCNAQESTVRSTFADMYRTRTHLLADYLAKHPDHQSQEGLKEISRIAKTDYVMRFDRNGQEVVSSNSYTGFSVWENLSEKYQPVLMGYPDAVVGPAADPYTGQR